MSRKYVIGGNWKCNGTVAQADSLIQLLNGAGDFPSNVEVVIAVPSLHLRHAKAAFRADIHTSAQDVSAVSGYGAYTGELSGAILKDSGIEWALAGHSERRVGFGGQSGESNETVGLKVKAGLAAGLKVIACIGEKLEDREAGRTMDVCAAQLAAIAAQVGSAEDWGRVVVAYEPVWAIGTGKVATPEQAEETHLHIRQWVAANVSESVAQELRIIYGGSVKGSNCVTLISCPNIDGFLVGGASLLHEFVDIIKSGSSSH